MSDAVLSLDEASEKIFGYYINLDERGEFYADVRDVYGKTIYEINGLEIFEDGFMAHKEDLAGLEQYLTSLGVLPAGANILPMDEFESRLDEIYELQQSGPRLG